MRWAKFAATSIPVAFIGGMITLPVVVYKIVLGAVLIADGTEPAPSTSRAPRV